MKTLAKMASNVLAPAVKKTVETEVRNIGCSFFLHEAKMPSKLVAEMQKTTVK